jgi:hypothetical protein
MERSLTLQQPPHLGRVGVADATNRLISWLFAAIFSRPAPAAAAPRTQEAWRSYAVYSGALPLRHYKSPRRHP